MSKETIVVTVGLNGEVEVSAEGFKGKGCEAATKFIEEALGMSGKRKFKPEYYATETVKQEQRT
jgi:hypothetical protein